MHVQMFPILSVGMSKCFYWNLDQSCKIKLKSFSLPCRYKQNTDRISANWNAQKVIYIYFLTHPKWQHRNLLKLLIQIIYIGFQASWWQQLCYLRKSIITSCQLWKRFCPKSTWIKKKRTIFRSFLHWLNTSLKHNISQKIFQKTDLKLREVPELSLVVYLKIFVLFTHSCATQLWPGPDSWFFTVFSTKRDKMFCVNLFYADTTMNKNLKISAISKWKSLNPVNKSFKKSVYWKTCSWKHFLWLTKSSKITKSSDTCALLRERFID